MSELEYHVADAYDQPVHALEIDRDWLIERDLGARSADVKTVQCHPGFLDGRHGAVQIGSFRSLLARCSQDVGARQ